MQLTNALRRPSIQRLPLDPSAVDISNYDASATPARQRGSVSLDLKKLEGKARPYRSIDIPGRDEKGLPFPRKKIDLALKQLVCPQMVTLKVRHQIFERLLRHIYATV